MIIPPTIPEITPAKRLAPEAKAIPRQSGRATRNTTNPEGRSYRRFVKRLLLLFNELIDIVVSEMKQASATITAVHANGRVKSN
jgi:hypothetical protein